MSLISAGSISLDSTFKEEEVEDSARDFDFEEEGGEVSTPQRRTPGGAQRVLHNCFLAII
jgi:hypothetical protein